MYSLLQLKTLASCGREPARSLPLRRGFLLIPLVLVCFAFAVNAQPAPETPDPGSVNDPFGTADGLNALKNVSGGFGNSAFGWYSLFSDTTASFNTGCGAGTLVLNNADSNTAVGTAALILNTVGTGMNTGTQNTAVGTAALVFNTGGTVDGEGSYNDAVGAFALNSNTTGYSNNALGNSALFSNVLAAGNTAIGDVALAFNDSLGTNPPIANANTAVGAGALYSNTDGSSNDAVGFSAMQSNTVGLFNQALGSFALDSNQDGASNIAIGDTAFADNVHGSFNTVIGDLAGGGVEGDDNIYIGATSGLPGGGSESGTIRIGDPTFVTDCYVAGIFGATATGGLPVVVNSNGKLGTVPAGSPLSMNELLKQRQLVQDLKATTEKQAARIALQEAQIKDLTTALRQQAEQIQKVSAQLEMIRPAPRLVENR